MDVYRLEYSGGSGSLTTYFSIAAASAEDLQREWQAFASNSQIVSILFMNDIELTLEVHGETVLRRAARPALTIEYDDGALHVDERGWPSGLGLKIPAELEEDWEIMDWLAMNAEEVMFREPNAVHLDLDALGVPILNGESSGEHVELVIGGQRVKHPWGLVGDDCMGHTFEAA